MMIFNKLIFSFFIFFISSNFLFNQIDKSKTKLPIKKTTKKKLVTNTNNQDSKSYIDLFNEAYLRLEKSYVDSVNGPDIILSGMKEMMSSLDPYTKVLMGKSKENYEILARGKYGGVGMKISEVRDTILITQVFEDSPSYIEGLLAGDMIIMIDSVRTIGLGRSATVKLLKGKVDTPVKLKIYRMPDKIFKEFTLRRSEIQVKQIPYYGLNEDNIGYIKLTKFSRNTSRDFRNAIIEMSADQMNGLIIDLRYNGGGLLREAINILDILLPKDEQNPLLVKKGKESQKKYFSKKDPDLDIDIPIVVLQNKRSASASEIVSGTLQDLDRAVILGQTSFGKGLVQITNKLNDTLSLKITTSKYYLPSGRIIQKNDYLGNNLLTDGLDKKDSTFFTKGGRIVEGGKGIIPDLETSFNKIPYFVSSLSKNHQLFLKFSNENASRYTEDAFSFYKNFLKYKYGDDYIKLDSTLFSINILNDRKGDYFSQITYNKENGIELYKKSLFLKDVHQIYKHLNRYERYQTLSYKDLNQIVIYIYMFKNYFIQSEEKDKRPVNELKRYLISQELYSEEKSSKNNKKVAGYSLYRILSKLLPILSKIDAYDIDDVRKYLKDVDYQVLKIDLDSIEMKQKALNQQAELQVDVINWYIRMLNRKYTSPHKNVPINEFDIAYIQKKINVQKYRNSIIDEFRLFIENFNFKFQVDSEKEFIDLKRKLLSSSQLSLEEADIGTIEKIVRKSKFKKLVGELDKYIQKMKKEYFYKIDNEKWIINMILREYAKLVVDNSWLVKTSLFIDSEYDQALKVIDDLNSYNQFLDSDIDKLN